MAKNTVIYRPMNCVVEKIREILAGMSDTIAFVTRVKRHGRIEMALEDENIAEEQAM